jgi:hypothetical protein
MRNTWKSQVAVFVVFSLISTVVMAQEPSGRLRITAPKPNSELWATVARLAAVEGRQVVIGTRVRTSSVVTWNARFATSSSLEEVLAGHGLMATPFDENIVVVSLDTPRDRMLVESQRQESVSRRSGASPKKDFSFHGAVLREVVSDLGRELGYNTLFVQFPDFDDVDVDLVGVTTPSALRAILFANDIWYQQCASNILILTRNDPLTLTRVNEPTQEFALADGNGERKDVSVQAPGLRSVIDLLAAKAGFEILSYKGLRERKYFEVRLHDVTYAEALQAILYATGHVPVRLGTNKLVLVENTASARRYYSAKRRLAYEAIAKPGESPRDFTYKQMSVREVADDLARQAGLVATYDKEFVDSTERDFVVHGVSASEALGHFLLLNGCLFARTKDGAITITNHTGPMIAKYGSLDCPPCGP